MPLWVMALIVVGSLVLITGSIIALTLLFRAPNPGENIACSLPGSCGQGIPPSASADAQGDTQNTPTPTTAPDTISIYTDANLGSSPIWGVLNLSGWDTKALDQKGVNLFANTTLGCTLTTAQTPIPDGAPPGNDFDTSKSVMEALNTQMKDLVTNLQVTPESPVAITLGTENNGATIEFTQERLDYTNTKGEGASSLFVRTMPQSKSIMILRVDCPRAVMDGADSPVKQLVGLAVVIRRS